MKRGIAVLKICLASNGGGHLEELKQLNLIWERYDCFYVVMKNKITEKMQEKTYYLLENTKKNKMIFLLKTGAIFFQSLWILLRENPDVVISTGAGATIPLCLLAKKLFRKKLIFIETFAKREGPSRTGKFLYPFADLFIVQWKELLRFYPKAGFGGSIF